MISAHDHVPQQDADHVHTSRPKKVRRSNTFAERVKTWAGEFDGESKQVLAEIIVAYYNETNVADSSAPVVKTRAKMAANLFRGHGLAVITGILYLESYFHTPSGTIDDAVYELKRHRRKFNAAVRWLCSPKYPKPAVSPQKLDILKKSGRLVFGRYPDIDRSNDRFVSYFEDHGLKHFRRHLALDDANLVIYSKPTHWIDLLCVFLVNECSGRDPSLMPVKLCRKCIKLFSVAHLSGQARKKREHCSTKCQVGHFWTKNRRADYRYVERLEDYRAADLRARLALPTVQKRLQQIETRWKEWTRLIDRLKGIRQVAVAKSGSANRR